MLHPLCRQACSSHKLGCFGQSLHARGTGGMTSPCRYYSYNFLLLEALLPFQPLSPSLWMWSAVLLCSTSEDFGISSAGVRWQLLFGMGSKCGNDCVSSGDLDVCVHACVCVQIGIFSTLTETPSLIVTCFLFSFLPSWHSLNLPSVGDRVLSGPVTCNILS